MLTKEDMLAILDPLDPSTELLIDQPDGPKRIDPDHGVDVRDGRIILKPANAWRWDRRRQSTRGAP